MDPARLDEARTTWHFEERVMGTVVTFDLYATRGVALAEVAPALQRARQVLHDADRTFSTWQPESPMSRLRRGELTLGETPRDVAEVLERCHDLRTLTRGWFDPWALPGGVDPTGFVKGWAAQRALDVLAERAEALDGAMVNAAGDIASFGSLDGQPFRIGITNPLDPLLLAGVIELRGAVATSGAYERGEHLLNPFAGTFTRAGASATVLGADLGLCDALATACIVAGPELLDLVDELAGYEALLIDDRGEYAASAGFAFAHS